MKCPNCGRSLDGDPTTGCYYCRRCGYTGDGSLTDRLVSGVTMLFTMVFGIGFMFILVLLSIEWAGRIGEKLEAKEKGYVEVGKFSEYRFHDYEDVVEELESKGFTYIITKDENDSGILFWTNDMVSSITIDGIDIDEWPAHYAPPNGRTVVCYH